MGLHACQRLQPVWRRLLLWDGLVRRFSRCYLQRGYLAEPLSEEEQTKINTYLTISNGGNVQNTWWIGGIDLHQEGVWTWMSGAPWSYEHWGEGEPNQNGNEDCLAIDPQQAGYGWMDLNCAGDNAVPRYAVCEKIVEG